MKRLLPILCCLLAALLQVHGAPSTNRVKIFDLPTTNFAHAGSTIIVNLSTNTGDTRGIELTNLLESLKTYVNWTGGGAGSEETQWFPDLTQFYTNALGGFGLKSGYESTNRNSRGTSAEFGTLFIPSGGSLVNSNASFRRRVAIWDDNQQLVPMTSPDISDAELGTIDGVTVNIQTQLDAKASLTQLLAASNAAVAFSMTVSNALAALELTRNAAVSNACVQFGMTVSNDVYTIETTRNAAVSNACIAFGMTVSNTVYTTETTRNAAVSNACVQFTMTASNTLYGLIGSGTAWNAIGDASGDGTIAFANTEQVITSTLDANGVAALKLRNTDTDLANPTALLNLEHYDSGPDADAIYTIFWSDAGGAPTEDYRFSQTAFNVASAVTTTLSGPVSAAAGATLSGLVTVNSNLVFTPRPFVLGGTNWFADGSRGMIFTNSHTALGLTNFYWTNLAMGQEITMEIFVGIGSTATLPQPIASDYTSGRIEGLTSNAVNVVKIRRTPMGTNVSVRTKEFTISGDGNVVFNTNLATMTITAGLAPTVTNSSNIKFRLQQPGITVSNLFLSFDTNRYLLRGLTNAVFTNFVELADGESADMSVYVHNTTGVSMGLVWPAFGAQHGYYFSTNANNDVRAKTSLASGARGLASFTIVHTNIIPTWTDW